METVHITGKGTSLRDVELVARLGAAVVLDAGAVSLIERARAVVDACVEKNEVRYGITTGFGKFCDVFISREDNTALQRNLIISHSCGVGAPLPVETVRAVMFLRANALSVGNSGARVSTVMALVNLLNSGVTPIIPEKGSLGASGDLAPLAHMVLTMIGEGEAWYRGEKFSSSEALSRAGLKPIVLAAKEGLALINGTQVMTAVGALAVIDSERLMDTADEVACITFQALSGITCAFDPRIHALRGQKGQIACAKRLLSILEGSKLTTKQGETRVQDAYTLRCIPQIHGASRDAIGYIKDIVEREINAVTDNPLIFPENGDILSGGNFHGQPVALPMDFLGIAVAEIAGVSERRIERLVNPALSGLPAFLTENGGINSGFMITQYTAAALVSENKVLAHPASVDSIPSSANQEDHVSMGTIAARKAGSILDNASNVVAIELLAACQAIDLRKARDGLSPATRKLYDALRAKAGMLSDDRIMYPDIASARAVIDACREHGEMKK